MKITEIECHVLLDPAYDAAATSSAQDGLVVEVHTDEGVSGIGESDMNPSIARACIEATGTHTMGHGLAELLVGRDPLDVEGLWEQLYLGTIMDGRRGAMISALGAVDIALHDLRGKVLGKPCYELLGGALQREVAPYASLQPAVGSFEEYKRSLVAWANQAKGNGFTAAKLEVTLSGPFAHMGLDEPNDRMGEVIAAVRGAVGREFTLMVDVQYAFPDADACLRTIRDWEELDLYFVETPLLPDDLEGYARLASEQPIPIAAGELLTTRFEFRALMDHGGVQIAQPDIGRVGGLTEARRVYDDAAARGRTIVPHLWQTGISIAAARHLAAAAPQCTFIEYLPREMCDSALRRELVVPEPELKDGKLGLPPGPGLGIEVDRDTLRRFSAAALSGRA